jgi:hypothetical protein
LVENFVANNKRFFLHNYTEFVPIDVNWNRCMDHIAKGSKYVKIVQADDILLPNSVSNMVALMEKYPSAGIGSSYRLVGTSVYGYGIDFLKGEFFKGNEILLAHLNNKMEITGSVTQLFFRLESLQKLPFYPMVFDKQEYHFDTRLAYEMFNISDVVFDYQVLNYTRRHPASETMTKVHRFNTLMHGTESRLYRFKDIDHELKKKYRKIRRQYAYFLFKNKIKGNKECMAWHNQFLQRKFNIMEYFTAILTQNKIVSKLF